MEVDDRLRRAGRAARVLPETHVRLARRGDRDLVRPVVEEVGVRVGHREHRTRVAKHEVELVRARQCREGHGDRADLRRAKKRGDEARRIAEHERDSIARSDATVAQPECSGILHRREVAVAQRFAGVTERRAIAAAGRARGVGESAREIERG